EQIRHINVATQGGGSNLGMLKGGGKLDWPIPVQGEKQEKLAAILPSVVAEASSGRLDPKSYREAVTGVADLQEELRKKFHKEEIDGGSYLVGKRFLDKLEGSIKGLEEPGSRKVLTGSYAAQGRNVPELVFNMSSKGLAFAPANPGDESA